ncbi:hypothetical protein [Oceanobacillus kapialis]|uniref:Uncharacterized protein n=1 Tax=Oceanobacillus kapialis TaxID=481353 RepID=A0ABW5Q3F3_9BACI
MKAMITSRILLVVGIIIILAGLYNAWDMARYDDYSGYGQSNGSIEWARFFMFAGSSMLYGFVLVGLAEIIRLLHKILLKEPVNQIHTITKTNDSESVVTAQEQANTVWELSREDEEKIYDLYSDKAILEIRPANMMGYCIVKVQDKSSPLNPEVKVVDVGGFKAKAVHDTDKRNAILEWYYQQ